MEAPAPEKKKNWFVRHKVWTAVLALLVVFFIMGSTGNSSETKTSATSSPTASNSGGGNTIAKVGQKADDGKFQFVVNSIKCGEATVGTQYLSTTAQGQFCRLNVSVTNIGTVAQELSDSNQYVYDKAGSRYNADTTADIYASSDSGSGTWLSTINPGNTVTGDIIYDVPKGTTPITAELHDSGLSGGVKVSLQ